MNLNKQLILTPTRFFLAFALALICQLFPQLLYADCPEEIAGFEYVGELNEHRYYLSQSEFQWSQASDIAFANGGYLTAITSAEENAFILENLIALNATTSAHIGLNDYEVEGNLMWSSGESVNFYNVNPIPQNTADFNNVSMNIWNNGGGWSLKSKWVQEKFIMELPCDELIPNANIEILSSTCPAEFPTPGALINFTAEVRNLDATPSSPQTFGFYQTISGDVPMGDQLVGQATIGVLQPNETGTVLFENVMMPDPFNFPSFTLNNVQWGNFYIKRFTNTTGTSLEADNALDFDIFCQTYSTDIAVDITRATFEYGDEGIVAYEGRVTNNGPAVAYNLKAIVGKTVHGSIPSVISDADVDILTYDDIDQTKVMCIDQLAVGESIDINVFYNFEPVLPDTLPGSFEVSIVAFSEHLFDLNGANNAISEVFVYNPFVSDDCPDNINGYQYLGQYNSNRFFISDVEVHWWEADSLALEAGGELTAIETDAENFFLYDYLEENVWIALSDHEQEGNFVWSNEEVVEFNNIQGGNGNILDYVSINHWNGAWVLNRASAKKKYVIEVPCNEVPGAFVDLTGSDIQLSTLTAEQLDRIDFNFRLTNNGNSDAANEFFIRTYLSADTILSENDPQVGDIETGFWGSDYFEIVEATEGINVPWNILLGEYYVLVAIDRELNGTSSIFESNESNNIIVSSQKLLVTGNICTLQPLVSDGDMIVRGIPQGHNSFILYGEASNIAYSYYCSRDCPYEIDITGLQDGDYTIAMHHWSSDWLEECSVFIDVSIFQGNISGRPAPSDTEFGDVGIFESMQFADLKDDALYPNPATDLITTTIESHFDSEAQLEIYDINGRLMLNKSIQLQRGIQHIELDIANLSRGMHHLILKSNNQTFSTQRFIKN